MKPYYENELLKIYCGDSASILYKLPEASVQLVVTSPPYDKLRTYEGGAIFDFETVAKGLYRVLCEGGVCCWNVNDSIANGSESLTSAKQKIFFHEQVGFTIHDTMIYQRLGFPAPKTVRYNQMFEYIFVLSKGKPMSFHPIIDRKNKYAGDAQFGMSTLRNADGEMVPDHRNRTISEFGMRSNVWQGNTASQENPCAAIPHPASMPKWLARDLIISWSNPGDTVLDPFGGGGTTSEQANEYGRKSISIEISPKYCELIRKRCEKVAPLLLVT